MYWGRIPMNEACSELVYIHSLLTWAGFDPHRCTFWLVQKNIGAKGFMKLLNCMWTIRIQITSRPNYKNMLGIISKTCSWLTWVKIYMDRKINMLTSGSTVRILRERYNTIFIQLLFSRKVCEPWKINILGVVQPCPGRSSIKIGQSVELSHWFCGNTNLTSAAAEWRGIREIC